MGEQQRAVTGKQAGAATIIALVFAILTATFANEGGYVDHRDDPGGATNHGITEAVARGKGYTGSMRALKRECDFPIVLPDGIRDALDEAALALYAQDNMARYKQPRLFIHLPELPMGANGKLLRRSLRAAYEAQR